MRIHSFVKPEELHEEIERLQQRVDTVREQERQTANEREQQLLDEIIRLNRQMARLEVRMEMMQEQDEAEDE